MKKARLLLHPGSEGLWNMAVDALLARAGEAPLTLRLYGWKEPTLSLGHIQDFDRDLARRTRDLGIPVVRRETGGRAVLHDHELTYCVCIPRESKLHLSSLPEAYLRIHRALHRGLARLGVETALEARRTDLAAAYRRKLGQLCFTATARSEVLFDGRKLVGSAQRRLREGLMQHGSLVLDRRHQRIVELYTDDPVLRDRAREELLRSTASLGEALGRVAAFEELSRALVAGFEEEYGLRFVERPLGDAESEAAAAMRECFLPERGSVAIPVELLPRAG